MGKFFLSAGTGLAAGAICFFLSVAFLCFTLLIAGALGHPQDLTLAYKAAAPVALMAAFLGFAITLVRSNGRTIR